MQHAIDYSGLAILITAIAGLLSAVGTLVLQLITLLRQQRNTAQLDSLHECLHEQTATLKDAIAESGK